MNKARLNIVTSKLVGNDGRLPWLPKNPRQWTLGDVNRTVKSITEDPDFLEDRPLLAVPAESGKGEKYVVFGGNLRLKACRESGVKTVPVVVYFPQDDDDYATIKRRAMKDNGSLGSWDFDSLANEWDDLPLADYGVPAWDTEQQDPAKMHLSSEGREGAEGYDEFVEKFKPKLTTDDCYTPAPVYDAVVKWVDAVLGPIDHEKIVRPFYPGGDYEHADYPEGCIVLDNPPFSIYAQIVRFYLERSIRFFLFGPHLTLKVKDADVTYVLCGEGVTYENGAVVNTSFVTNLPKVQDYRIIIPVELRRAVKEADKESRDKVELSRYRHPMEFWTLPVLSKIAKGDEDYYVRKDVVQEVQNLDCLKEQGKSLYGGGFLFSSAAAREAAAREAAALILSERELCIVAELDKRNMPDEF